MKLCFRLLILGVLLSGTPARSEVAWTVISSDETSITLGVVSGGATIEPAADGFARVRLPGAHADGEPGFPALPVDARWIALPPGATPRLSVEVVRVDELGTARLLPVPVAELAPAEVQGPRLIERVVPAEGYDGFRRGESGVVSMGRPVRQRRHATMAVGVRPVLYDAATGQVRLVRELEIRISWSVGSSRGIDPAPSDPTILRSVLNPDQARVWAAWSPAQARVRDAAFADPFLQRDAPAAGISVLDPTALAADGIRLRVNASGIVRVSVADLVASGGLPLDVPRSWLRVVQTRSSEAGSAEYPLPLLVDVPLHFLGAPDESQNLAARDEIFFHALRVEDDADTLTAGMARALPALPWGESNSSDTIPARYTGDHFNRDNVYWVYLMEPPAGGWSRMEAVGYSPSGGSPATSYLRKEHFEGDQGYREEPFDPWVERYAWNRRDELDVVRSLRLFNPVPGSNLIVRWFAGGHISGSRDSQGNLIPVDFSLRQSGTEQPLLSLNLNNRGLMTDWTSTVSASPFGTGTLEFRMRRIFNGVDVWVNSFLDNVELEYPAEFRAVGDGLRFSTGISASVADVEVEGFGRSDLVCFDVTDPRAPRWIDLTEANLEDQSGGGSGSFTLSMNVAQPDGEKTFVVAPSFGYTRVGQAAIEADPVADLFDAVDDLQVVAIGPEGFRSQTDRWISWREQTYAASGWRFGYVDVQQVYDQFSGGLQSPWAIRQFVEFAWVNWGATAVVLVGDANEDVLNAGGRAGPNHVPPSLHLQSFTGSRELLASDKWYGLFGYEAQGDRQYPQGLEVTSDLLVGRFAVADEQGLAALVDKIMAYEQTSPDAAWRKRTLWVADDAYSSDLIGAGSGCYRFQSIEQDFLSSQQVSAAVVESTLDQTISSSVQNSDEYTIDCRQGNVDCENLPGVRSCFDSLHRTDYVSRWSEGWLWLSYQGHANFNVLGHENLILASGISQLNNDGRPWVFFGMGCHVSDFLRAEEGTEGASIGELVLRLPRAGAIATYGSSGFEFLTPNKIFMEVLTEAMFDRRVPDSPVLGPGVRNQWILGDVMARGELETLALRSSLNIYKGDEMVSQYNLLGDPLLRMDAGAPRMTASRGGQPVGDGATIEADPGLPFTSMDLSLVDESGLDRVEVTDSEGRDYSAVTPGLGGPDPRQESVVLELPVYPQDYTLELATFDAARPELRRTVLGLQVSLGIDFRVDGEPVEPGSRIEFEPDVPRSMEVDFTSPVDLVEADIAIDFPGVDVLSESIAGAERTWSVSFEARSRPNTEPGPFNLVLQGLPTQLLAGERPPEEFKVEQHVVFPNPVNNAGRVVIRASDTTVESARMSVYDLAGNQVSVVETTGVSQDAEGRFFLAFEARDRRGDELANGTYFYRISITNADGSVARSDMGRLLVMR